MSSFPSPRLQGILRCYGIACISLFGIRYSTSSGGWQGGWKSGPAGRLDRIFANLATPQIYKRLIIIIMYCTVGS